MTSPEPDEPHYHAVTQYGTLRMSAADNRGAIILMPAGHVLGHPIALTAGADLNPHTLALGTDGELLSIRRHDGQPTVWYAELWDTVYALLPELINTSDTYQFRLDVLRWYTVGLERHLAWLDDATTWPDRVAEAASLRPEIAVCRRTIAAHTEPRADVREAAIALCAGSPEAVEHLTPAEMIAVAEQLVR